ncbi:hypothetical protein MNBD_DELTA02-898 [hydrothermal vent metagenome]|uniref:Uncharacterized protein n=1 Tax=hydrothermal vent metagenome TaxID=652676 RepID=A0A3B0V8A3_9ZZZZ
MEINIDDWKRGVRAGILAGIAWGWIALATNWLTGAFPLEEGLVYELISFAIGGAIFGTVVGGFLVFGRDLLPFKRLLPKAVLLSTLLWLILRTAGAVLSMNDPNRYHPALDETLQGLVLAITMGGLTWLFWGKRSRTT